MDSILIKLDKSLFLYLNGIHSAFFDLIMYWASNMLLWIPVYLFFLLIFQRTLISKSYPYITSKNILIIGFILVDILICVELLPPIFSAFASRIKPCYDPEISSVIHTVGDQCVEKFGFFTYRSCTIFAISTFLFFAFGNSFKWMKFCLIFLAILVSYSRIYLGAHYPLNVLASALLGITIGYLSYRLYFYIKNSVLII